MLEKRQDQKKTKDKGESWLEKIVGGIITIPMIPIFIYKLYKIDRAHNKREKQRKRMAADEGFYQEIHPNKNVNRY